MVQTPHERLLIKHIRTAIDAGKHRANGVGKVGISFVGDMIFGGPHFALHRSEGFRMGFEHKERHQRTHRANQHGNIFF